MKSKHSKDTFVKKAKKVQKEKGREYDYSKVDYKNSNTKVIIICPIHGDFEQRPSHHLRGSGCPKCFGKKKKTFEVFKKEVYDVHGNSVTVLKKHYNGLQKKVKASCVDHGDFEIYAYDLLRKGCQKCGYELGANKRKLSKEDFVNRAIEVNGNLYNYLGDYVDMHTKIEIECKLHGVFKQTPHNHLKGRGCPKCGQEKVAKFLKNEIGFVKNRMSNVHNGKYNYSLFTKYENSRQKIDIICPKHGVFNQEIAAHTKGANCPKCANKISQPEMDLTELIKSYGLKVVSNDRTILNGLELDILIPDKKVAIEYNGLMFHREGLVKTGIGGGKSKNYHLNKTILAQEKGYKLIHIFEDEWLDKKDIVVSKIKHILGVNDSEKVYARKCIIKQIDSKISKKFLDKNHIQGSDNTKIRLGAYYNEQLVGVMTFLSYKDNTYKLNRYATNNKFRVIGLASKLLKHFIRKYNPNKITTFADRRFTNYSENSVYDKLGFKLVEEQKPVYHYINVNKQEFRRYNRQRFMKHKILEMYPMLSSKLTEKELMVALGYDRIWDCGHFKFELELNI